MALDFQEVRKQVRVMGENAALREKRLHLLREQAKKWLNESAQDPEAARRKVEYVSRTIDPNLRCALPTEESISTSYSLPKVSTPATILAADGSQINPNRHAQVDFCLINVGAVRMRTGSAVSPSTFVESQLIYGEQLYTETGKMTEAMLALSRDLKERTMLADLAEKSEPPVIAFTDGPLELWGAKNEEGAPEFEKSLAAYLEALQRLCYLDTITAGYVDKPAAALVVRLLEVNSIPNDALLNIRKLYPLRGVTDIDLFKETIGVGERSAVFAIQSKSASLYQDQLALHFFYLNVGRENDPWLARVEIPAWVAGNPLMLDALHTSLVQQCRIMGSRYYPYLLHRSHEVAVVTREEQEQVTQMIIQELYQRGVSVGQTSHKQSAKNLEGKKRYET